MIWLIQLIAGTLLLACVFLVADKIATETHRFVLKRKHIKRIKKQTKSRTLWSK